MTQITKRSLTLICAQQFRRKSVSRETSSQSKNFRCERLLLETIAQLRAPIRFSHMDGTWCLNQTYNSVEFIYISIHYYRNECDITIPLADVKYFHYTIYLTIMTKVLH